ncbi:helix-turn-helix domain-containing protein [Sinorhizobium meliloti]|uniref:helix-turn-helix domain-containing protein n=1 Tax=Rhizobium meliloti TaxID=382 RepID=UPI0013E317A7|nr:helix-turn-helix domain-containing protein [Sinorhizobium meliloti]
MNKAASLTAANEARKETAEFHHKAVLILAERGWTTCGIAECLGISQRTVRSLRKLPCEALEREREEKRKREARERYARIKQRNAPFDVGAFLEEEAPHVLKAEEITWLGEWKTLPIRKKVKKYLLDGKVSQVAMARLLGITRQAVSKHVEKLRDGIVQ